MAGSTGDGGAKFGIASRTRFKAKGLRYDWSTRVEHLLRPGKIDDIVSRFNARRMILVVSTGRSGTTTLNERLDVVPGLVALHEPAPHYRHVIKWAQCDYALAARFFAYVKAPALLAYRGDSVLETNHLFGKGFFEPAVALGFRFGAVMLSRDKRATAVSHMLKNAVPGRTLMGERYQIAPDDDVYVAIADPASLSDYQLCYWYCHELAQRERNYAVVCADLGLPAVDLTTDDLNDSARLAAAFATLGLGSEDALRRLLDTQDMARVHNARPEHKKRALEIDFDAEEVEVERRIVSRAGPEESFARIARVRRMFGR